MEWKSVTHKLMHPVIFNDSKIEAIILREPDVDALEQIEELGLNGDSGAEGNIGVRALRKIITALSDQPAEVIKKMHKDDFTAISEVVAPLLDQGPTTNDP